MLIGLIGTAGKVVGGLTGLLSGTPPVSDDVKLARIDAAERAALAGDDEAYKYLQAKAGIIGSLSGNAFSKSQGEGDHSGYVTKQDEPILGAAKTAAAHVAQSRLTQPRPSSITGPQWPGPQNLFSPSATSVGIPGTASALSPAMLLLLLAAGIWLLNR